jgi:hypothetical protein
MYNNPIIPAAATGVILTTTNPPLIWAIVFGFCGIFAITGAIFATKRSLPAFGFTRKARARRQVSLLANRLADRNPR